GRGQAQGYLSFFSSFLSSLTRLASQSCLFSMSLMVVEIVPLIASSVTLPLYLVVNLLPPNSRVTLNEISPFSYLPSSIFASIAFFPPPVRVPVSFPSLYSSFRVFSTSFLPNLVVNFQVPVGSGSGLAAATTPTNPNRNATTTNFFIGASPPLVRPAVGDDPSPDGTPRPRRCCTRVPPPDKPRLTCGRNSHDRQRGLQAGRPHRVSRRAPGQPVVSSSVVTYAA